MNTWLEVHIGVTVVPSWNYKKVKFINDKNVLIIGKMGILFKSSVILFEGGYSRIYNKGIRKVENDITVSFLNAKDRVLQLSG